MCIRQDVRVRQLHQVQAGHVAQQPDRPVAGTQQPQRVTGRVVGDPVRVVGAHVFHPEHVDEQLRQLERPPGHGFGAPGQLLVTAPPGDHRMLVPD